MVKNDKGVCFPIGFMAAGISAGFKKSPDKKDLALIYSQKDAETAAVYTKNKTKGAPLLVTKKHLLDGVGRAIICNSGNANTCVKGGIEIAEETCKILANKLGIEEGHVLVASTGVIGQPLSLQPFIETVPLLVKSLSYEGSRDAAQAILTTDLNVKESSLEISLGGIPVRIGGIAKGSGMINPNMATMLAFITTDANLSHILLNDLLLKAVNNTFNQISVDGDTSTNDMVIVMANGMSEAKEILGGTKDYDIFYNALEEVCRELAIMIAKDGEGARKLICCEIRGAKSNQEANEMAKAVISSLLVKTAMYGEDANWGRIICALGYGATDTVTSRTDMYFKSREGEIQVCKEGNYIPFDEERAGKILASDEITIFSELKDGIGEGRAWGCDLSYEYIRINGNYRT